MDLRRCGSIRLEWGKVSKSIEDMLLLCVLFYVNVVIFIL